MEQAQTVRAVPVSAIATVLNRSPKRIKQMMNGEAVKDSRGAYILPKCALNTFLINNANYLERSFEAVQSELSELMAETTIHDESIYHLKYLRLKEQMEADGNEVEATWKQMETMWKSEQAEKEEIERKKDEVEIKWKRVETERKQVETKLHQVEMERDEWKQKFESVETGGNLKKWGRSFSVFTQSLVFLYGFMFLLLVAETFAHESVTVKIFSTNVVHAFLAAGLFQVAGFVIYTSNSLKEAFKWDKAQVLNAVTGYNFLMNLAALFLSFDWSLSAEMIGGVFIRVLVALGFAIVLKVIGTIIIQKQKEVA